MTVPAIYQGLWRRTGIRRSNGESDYSTQVWWLQSAGFHIDLRIPIDRPSVANRTQFTRLAPSHLLLFGKQTGFAGKTLVSGKRCEWHPDIAFPALGTDLDAGWMRFDSDDTLHETGVDNSYEEDWVRMASGPMRGVRLEEGVSGNIAYVIAGERWMAWACGHPGDSFNTAALPPSVQGEFTVLHKGGGWRIAASTLPWLEGEEAPGADALEQQQWDIGSVVQLPFAAGDWRVAALG